MKPGFALTLSDDGIRLLHRAGNGWTPVGDADLEDDALEDTLRFLRKTAAALAPEGVTSKLVLPNSQILYTEIDAPGPGEQARRAQIEAALAERTPYPIEELVYDWSVTGETVQVAAVTRLTLSEAEGFAAEHGFNPVCFVANPDPEAFEGEPWFGLAESSADLLPAGTSLERDTQPVRVTARRDQWQGDGAQAGIGHDGADEPDGEQAREATLPDAEPAAEVEAEAEAEAEAQNHDPSLPGSGLPPEEPAGVSGATVESGEADAETTATSQAESASDLNPAQNAGVQGSPPVATAEAEPAPSGLTENARDDLRHPGVPESAPDLPGGEDTAPVAPSPALPDQPADATAGRFRAAHSDPAGRPPASSPEDEVPEAPFAVVDPDEPLPDELPAPPGPISMRMAAHRGQAAPSGFASRRKPPFGANPDAPATSAIRATAPRLGGVMPAVGVTAPLVAAPSDGEHASGGPAGPALTPAGAMLGEALRKRGARKAPAQRQDGGRVDPTSPQAAPETGVPRQSLRRPVKTAAQESQELTVFGARRSPAVGGKPRYLGPALIGGLIALIGLIGLWSSFSGNENPRPAPDSAITSGAGAEQSSLAPERSPDQAADRQLAGDEQSAIAEAAPAPAEGASKADVAAATPDNAAETASAQTALPSEDPASATPSGAPAAAGSNVAAAGAAGIAGMNSHAAQSQPDATAADSIAPDSIPDTTEAAELPAGRSLLHDPPLSPQPLPLPFGQLVKYGADGLIIPSKEGVQTPSGITLYLGKPPLSPKGRPAQIAEAALAAAAAATAPAAAPVDDPAATAAGVAAGAEPAAPHYADPKLRGKKPAPRPLTLPTVGDQGNLAPDTALPAPVDPRHAARQPAPRPAAIVARAAEAAAAAPTAAEPETIPAADAPVTGGTRLAVAQSRRPAERPSDVSKAVASALAAAVTEPEPAPEVAAATANTAPEAAPAVPNINADAAIAEASSIEIDEPEPVSAAPSIPTRASVAKQATYANAIDLGKINLIGIMGSSADRRALIRTSNGRYVRVKVGDRFDGGRVAAIGNGQLTYVKGGRTVVLRMVGSG